MNSEKLFTVGELAKRCGVTVRTLQFYDQNGLLTPSRYSEGGRRLYGIDDLLRLQQILFYKGFGFPLEDIRDRLMNIQSSHDFASVLMQQRKVVEKQIEYLAETMSLMDKTIDEINQEGSISMEMAVAILSLMKQDNFLAFVMKNFEHDQIVKLMNKAELNLDEDPISGVWKKLFIRLKNLYETNADPYGEDGRQIAKDWWDMVMELTGGDAELIAAMIKTGVNMDDCPEESRDIKMAIENFLSPALGNYFIENGIAVPGMEG